MRYPRNNVKEKVLITTSGLGSRLSEYTSFTNKSLVSIGDAPAITRIIESYPLGTHFVVTLGYKGELVHDYLKIAHPATTFEFVGVDNFAGEGSSLAYSMLRASNLLQCPFIFHAGDTLSDEVGSLTGKPGNWITGAKEVESDLYVSFDQEAGVLTKIHQKGQDVYDYVYPGVVGIEDYLSFWSHLRQEVEGAESTDSIIDLNGIKRMVDDGVSFQVVPITDWRDIGSMAKMLIARSHFGTTLPTLEKMDESIFRVEGHVIKFFADPAKVAKRVERAKALAPGVPDVVDASKNFYKYEFVHGEIASHRLSTERFESLLSWAHGTWWSKKTPDLNSGAFANNEISNFYISKTITRLTDFEVKHKIQDCIRTINGKEYPSVREMMKIIANEHLLQGVPRLIHGDFVLDNIVVTEDGPIGIDWREDFGGNTQVGDLNYDLAKLYHSCLISHEALRDELFICEEEEGEFFVDIWQKKSLTENIPILEAFIDEHCGQKEQVQIIVPLIWINMSPMMNRNIGKLLMLMGQERLGSLLAD